jgi:ketosteroid isomerase-like protein
MSTSASESSTALQRMLDRQAITDAIHTYCRCVDLVDADGVAALFIEDCVVDYGPGLGGPTHGAAALRERLARGLPRFAATSHHVSNVEIDLAADGTSATSITYVMAWHRYPGDLPDATLHGQYHDTWVRGGDAWRIATRTLRVAGQTNFDVEWHPIGRNA